MNDEQACLIDTAQIFHYHRSLIKEYGDGTGSLGWMKTEGQLARFEMLAQIGNMNNCSVLDAGCGHADLFTFLKSSHENVDYYGLEQIPELLEIAAGRFQEQPGLTLLSGDFMQVPIGFTDYVLACGSLTYHHSDIEFIYKAIQKLFDSCRVGLGFNLLKGVLTPGSILVAYDPYQIYSFCKKISCRSALHIGYWQDDFTIFMFK